VSPQTLRRGISGSADDRYQELSRLDVERLGDVLANPMQRAGAARADRMLQVDHGLDLRQTGRLRQRLFVFGFKIAVFAAAETGLDDNPDTE